jgi:short-subunit dehydrogenase
VTEADFAERYGRWALIAGGSEGLGAAFAHGLAKRGMKLMLVARKSAPLETLAAQIRFDHGTEVRTLAIDLTEPDAVARIISATQGCEVGMLVYNAGADSKVEEFVNRTLDESARMIALNVSTPLSLIRHLAPAMVARHQGGIILVSSFASTVGTPGNAVYAATKAFSNILAEGLWYELGKQGIHVLGMIIGIARTPAMERMGLSFEGLQAVAEPYDLAEEAFAHIEKGPTLHAGGIHDEAFRLRSLPRADAVRAIAGFSSAVVSNKSS